MYNIRFANTTDLPHLIYINHQLGNYGWPTEHFAQLLAMDTPMWVIETASLQICGFLVASFLSEDMKILNLTIDQNFQGQGIGQRLLQHVLLAAKDHGSWFAMLEVRVDNQKAIKLYNNLGFKTLCVRDEYYLHLPVQEAYLMQLDLRKLATKPLNILPINAMHKVSDTQLLAS